MTQIHQKNKYNHRKPIPSTKLEVPTEALVQFSHSVVSNSLRPREPQHARPPCPSPTPGVYSNSCPLRRCCHPTISYKHWFSSCSYMNGHKVAAFLHAPPGFLGQPAPYENSDTGLYLRVECARTDTQGFVSHTSSLLPCIPID